MGIYEGARNQLFKDNSIQRISGSIESDDTYLGDFLTYINESKYHKRYL